MSIIIKEEITKELETKVIRVTQYPSWLNNIILVPKKYGKIWVCVDYDDLSKASPKDDFRFPKIFILLDNCAKHDISSFVDFYEGYHQCFMFDEVVEKTFFITPWGTYYYRVMPFGLKNVRATFMRAMKTMFYDMLYQEIDVYVDDEIIESKGQSNHVQDLRRFFERLCMCSLKLNLAKHVFGLSSGRILGFIVSWGGIEIDLGLHYLWKMLKYHLWK